jgi:putative ABC transport system ATP-binding protein
MLHEGRAVLDVAGETRKGLDVPDLLALFARQRGPADGQALADDSLLLG